MDISSPTANSKVTVERLYNMRIISAMLQTGRFRGHSIAKNKGRKLHIMVLYNDELQPHCHVVTKLSLSLNSTTRNDETNRVQHLRHSTLFAPLSEAVGLFILCSVTATAYLHDDLIAVKSRLSKLLSSHGQLRAMSHATHAMTTPGSRTKICYQLPHCLGLRKRR